MKKYSWIVALLLALSLAFVFVGCGGGGGSDPEPDPNLEDLVVEGKDIVLKACGNKYADATIVGNTFELDDVGDLSNVGFYYEFPADVVGKGYGAINVEMEVVSITTPDFIGFMTYAKSDFSGPVNVLDKKTGTQKTGQYDHEFKLGVECEKGAAGDTKEGGDGILDGSSKVGVKQDYSYPFVKFTDRIAFQPNPYAGNITTAGFGSTSKATYKIAVTKVTFVGGKVADSPVDEKAIPGVNIPFEGQKPVTEVGTSAQYTGAVTWAGTLASDGTFVKGTAYTATITLTAKEGFTLKGVTKDFFTVTGATATNAADSGVVTAVFPPAEAPPAEVVLFDLAAWIKDIADGEISGNLASPLQKAGSPKVTVDGGKLVISDRAQGTWEGVDIVVSGFTYDYTNFNYTLTVSGYTSAASNLKAGQTGQPYNEIGNVTTDGTTTVATFTKPVPEKDTGGSWGTPAEDHDPAPFGNIRVNSDVAQSGGSYTLTSVILKGTAK